MLMQNLGGQTKSIMVFSGALFTPYGVNNAWSKQIKMADVNSRFATISEAEILKIQDAAAPENTKKATKSVVEITDWV